MDARKLSLIFFVTFLVMLNLSSVNAEVSLTTEELPEPGTTPDNFFYFFDVLIDNIRINLIFDPDEKIETGLQVSNERLAELKAMSEKGDISSMQVAKREYERVVSGIKGEFGDIEDAPLQELKKVLDVERKINYNRRRIENIEDDVKIKIKIEGSITEDQKAMIRSVFNGLEAKTNELNLEIKNKKQETKVKIGQEGMHADEIERAFKEEMGILGEEKSDALGEIVRATKVIERIVSESANDPTSQDVTIEVEIEIARELLGQSKVAYVNEDYEVSRQTARTARDVLEHYDEDLPVDPEDLEEDWSDTTEIDDEELESIFVNDTDYSDVINDTDVDYNTTSETDGEDTEEEYDEGDEGEEGDDGGDGGDVGTCDIAGDLSGNGCTPDMDDLDLLAHAIYQPDEYPFDESCTDYNGDGVVDNSDFSDMLGEVSYCRDCTPSNQCSEATPFYYCESMGIYHRLILDCDRCANGACSAECPCGAGIECVDGICQTDPPPSGEAVREIDDTINIFKVIKSFLGNIF